MYIKDVFTQFTKERHAEDKGKHHDMLQEVYANTEFIDLSLYQLEELPLENFEEGRNCHSTNFICGDFSLPFENNFVKLSDLVYLFIREYAPNTITGTIYYAHAHLMVLNIPFTIHLSMLQPYIISDFYEPRLPDSNAVLEETFVAVNSTCKVLNNLSKHAVAVDVPTGTKHEYFRRKHGTTIKVPERPIYYVLDKQEEKKKYKYNDIKARGTLEFSHAFKVRGHWRKVSDNTYGKDRNGIYKVKGYTWVTEHVKGEGELVKKVRVVK